ncbi:MAG: MprA protease, GlyGly-CTERM protein-sorting domain-containing form [Verrucomicrobia bacterium]|nr:MAG: MprA protease, GlyGly-CTERM protein-sorting domain-containing form [Verrucomicrobiota bacterium]
MTYLTRVAPFNDWILATIPEPGTASLLLVAALLGWCRRRE